VSAPPGRVVVTGAGGFIGRGLCAAFAGGGHAFEGWSRERGEGLRGMGDLAAAPEDALARALDGADAVVHLAGRAHARVSTEQLRRDNVEASARLARAARRAGVRRFVHASSVKVNGESTLPGRPFRPDDVPAPADPYARSKLDAEQAVAQVLEGTSTMCTVLRLALVYGPRVRGNVAALIAAVRAGRALPFAAVRNRRHLASLANVVEAITAVLQAEDTVAGVHFVADANSISTPELVRAIALAAGVRARLYPVPVAVLRIAAAAVGRSEAIARLTGSLEVDTTSLEASTSWRPRPFGIDAVTVAP
jgi:nucleoside-diphosphate-sugar epimerase